MRSSGRGVPEPEPGPKAIKERRILVNGEKARTDWFPQPGWVSRRDGTGERCSPVLKIDLDILFQDDHLAVVFKPPGIMTRGNTRRTVHRALRHNMDISPLADAFRCRTRVIGSTTRRRDSWSWRAPSRRVQACSRCLRRGESTKATGPWSPDA